MSTPVKPILPVGADPTADSFQIASLPPQVGFLKRAVQPPSQVYIETSDVLIANCASAFTQEVVTFSYRILRFDGVLIHGQFTVTSGPNETIGVHSEQLAEGFLLSMSCTAKFATTRGETFVRAYLTKPSLGIGQPSYVFLADYVTQTMMPAYPGGRVLAPTEGPGRIVGITSALPGLGNDFTLGVSPNFRFRMIGVLATFQTSAVVANRTVRLRLLSNGFHTFFGGLAFNQTAGQTITYSWGAGYTSGFDGVAAVCEPFPEGIILQHGDALLSVTNNIDVGDSWTELTALVESWLDGV